MASSIIHLAIAKELKNKINIENDKDYYLGSIAPDLAKQIGQNKRKSHFIINSFNTPNIDLFIKRYPMFKYNSFDLGYFIHIYTDKLWDERINEIYEGNSLKLLDGTIIQTTFEEFRELLYSDYTNLNISIIEEYDLDLSLFYEEFKIPNTNLNEIPINKLDMLINKMGIIIENSKEEKKYLLDINVIKNFINDTVEEIEKEIEKY